MTATQGEFEVVRLITRLNIGGPARQALLLTKELRDRWPTLLAAGIPAVDEGELTDPQVRVHRVSLVRPVRPLDDARAWRQVSKLLRMTRPKIVHTHMAKAGMIGRRAARAVGARTIHTYHGHVHQGYFDPVVQRVFIEIERSLARFTDILIAISPEIRDELLDLGIGRHEQYRVIPLGFDLSDHLEVTRRSGKFRARFGLPRDVPLVGYIGRLVPIKDVQTLLKAMVQVPNAHLVVVGDGELRAELEDIRRDLRLNGRVHFTGWYRDVAEAMSDMDIVGLSSLNEGTPVSLIEAAACGRPVVATDVGGVRYVVDHEVTGLLCPPRQPEVMASHIRTLTADAGLRRRMGDAGRIKVQERFHKDRLVDDIKALYADLVS